MFSEYRYLYETHLHTSAVSACARNSGEEMAVACKNAGYAGVIVTEHNWGGNSTLNRKMPWEDYVELFCQGYDSMKYTGNQIGLSVFFGWEAGYRGTEFLIYGLDKTWLLAHEEIRRATIEEQYALVHEAGGIVIHAHPFREESYIPEIRLYPEYVDGIEVINATHSNTRSHSHFNRQFNKMAAEYAGKHGFSATAGSDLHDTSVLGGGMLFQRKLDSIQDFVKAFRQKESYLLTDGERIYGADGHMLRDKK